MAIDFFGSPPPGIDLSQTRTVPYLIVVIVLFLLALFTVLLRVFTTLRLVRRPLGLDDYLMFIGLIFNAANMGCCIAGSLSGMGRHVWTLTSPEIRRLMITTWLYVLVHSWSVCIIKCSILALYHRIFGMTRLAWFSLALTTGYLIANHIVFGLFARPISYYWHQYDYGAKGVMLVNEKEFFVSSGAINVFGDLCILAVPVSSVLKLRMERTQKILTCMIFLLGSLVCFASVYRIVVIFQSVPSYDISWSRSAVFLWSSVEPSVGIISGCLPTLRPLMLQLLDVWFKYVPSTRNTSSCKNSRSLSLNPLETISTKRTRRVENRNELEESRYTQIDNEGDIRVQKNEWRFSATREGDARIHAIDRRPGDDEICLTTTESHTSLKVVSKESSFIESHDGEQIIMNKRLAQDEITRK